MRVGPDGGAARHNLTLTSVQPVHETLLLQPVLPPKIWPVVLHQHFRVLEVPNDKHGNVMVVVDQALLLKVASPVLASHGQLLPPLLAAVEEIFCKKLLTTRNTAGIIVTMTVAAKPAPRQLTAAECADLLTELERLKQQVEVAIGCVESGLMFEDSGIHDPTGRYDTRIGDFLITDTKRRHL